MKVITIKDIPDKIHNDFKIYCVANNISMRKELIRLMEDINLIKFMENKKSDK